MSHQLQHVTILGSTGSIGSNTLDVIARHPDRFKVFALTANRSWEKLLEQCAKYKPSYAVLTDLAAAKSLADRLIAEGMPTQVLSGTDALKQVASDAEVDIVMAAIVGAAGLAPCMVAAMAGKRLLLANKEALVVGGQVFMDAVQQGGATLLPIDSEHSAIFQSLPDDASTWATRIEKIILTASGGPFLTRDLLSFPLITPDEACAHPNWIMGRKISVDSATMMNKALEVIEAKYLFGVATDQIEVVIHPQSIVHSMVQYHDSSIVAQLGTADMRVPIAYGLSWPERIASGATKIDFKNLAAMTFSEMDWNRFPCLRLAWDAMSLKAGPIVLNAVNEVAVQAFLDRKIRFDQIHTLNAEVLSSLNAPDVGYLDEVLAVDAMARGVAQEALTRIASS